MNVNVSMKKVVIGIVVLLIIGGAAYWWNATKDERAAKAGLEIMIKHAQKQALEIAIIEQASKLTDYRKQLRDIQQARPDPKDVDVD